MKFRFNMHASLLTLLLPLQKRKQNTNKQKHPKNKQTKDNNKIALAALREPMNYFSAEKHICAESTKGEMHTTPVTSLCQTIS